MKKNYQHPETIVAELNLASQLLTGTVKSVSSTTTTGLTYKGGSTTAARTKEYNDWDDWEE
ncbi:MAG: hypothetical protein IKX44_03825 [Prevotella sp.]|nr:hypothetical protein [Prevotella sp.]